MLTQVLFNGLVAGAAYATFAVGFTLVFGIHRILNLAQGYVFAWGAIAALYVVRDLGLPWLMGAVVAAVAGGLISVLCDLAVFRPLDKRRAPESAGLIASIGIGLILQSFAQQATNTEVHRFPESETTSGHWTVAGVNMSSVQITTLLTAAVMTVLLGVFLRRTQAGVRARAVAASADTAGLLGVNASVVRVITFLVGGIFAGVSGVLIGTAYNSVHFMMGETYLLVGMAVVTLGGMGSVLGAFLGGILIGVVRELTMAYVSTELSEALPFIVLLAVLLIRPQGLFGTSHVTGVVRAGRA